MNLKQKAGLIGMVATLSAPALAFEGSVRVGGDARWFDWREEIGGEQLLYETGPLFAPVLSLELRRDKLYAGVEAAWGGGLTRYDGRLQTGPGYEADAWEEFIDTEWRIGWREERGGLHIGYMQRDWRRHIEGSAGVSSAEERYRWRLLTLGGEAALFNSADWHVALTIGLPLESYQKVYSGFYDDFTLEPGDGLYWRLALPYQPPRAAGGALTIEPYYQQQTMGASDVVMLNAGGVPQNVLAYQPESIRRELGVTLRWRIGATSAPELRGSSPAQPQPL